VALVACRFCREMFDEREHQECPTCGIALERFTRLGLSSEGEAIDDALGPPEEPTVPFGSVGHMRGPLVLVACVGLAAFFLPWVHLTFPWHESRSGYDLARGRMGWLWGVACAWFVALPIVLSRRTLTKMRTARVTLGALAATPLVAFLVLALFPPAAIQGIKVRFHYGVGAWVTCVVAVLGIVLAAFFGRQRSARVAGPSAAHAENASEHPRPSPSPPDTLH